MKYKKELNFVCERRIRLIEINRSFSKIEFSFSRNNSSNDKPFQTKGTKSIICITTITIFQHPYPVKYSNSHPQMLPSLGENNVIITGRKCTQTSLEA